MSRIHRVLVGVVVAGAMVIAAIGFAGSYAAVRELAERKGFGAFSPFFPIGVDAGIVVLLALDLLLTWIRIPFPLLRQTAWLLTAATIAFNGAAAWPDPLGVGMHAVIPVLFVVTVEAARHATGRVAAITADKHMEGVRLSRWLLAFPSTFRLWRRMKLWELRSYEEVIRMEQDRLVYETRLRARYGRSWRRRAPVEALMPLKLARYGVPLRQTAPEATRLTEPPALTEPAPEQQPAPDASAPLPQHETAFLTAGPTEQAHPHEAPSHEASSRDAPSHEASSHQAPSHEVPSSGTPSGEAGPSGVEQPAPEPLPEGEPVAEPAPEAAVRSRAPYTPARTEELFIEPRPPERDPEELPEDPEDGETDGDGYDPYGYAGDEPVGIPDGVPREEVYFEAYRQYVATHSAFPGSAELARTLRERMGVATADGTPLSEAYLDTYMREFRDRYNIEMGLAG
ncbi:DUF2637 domain-containing protein [Streptomyces albus subsp. chlorinus]|nr:DUF2637 domain-containing protein [Streptomyces albus]NSC23218.1 DUF2637 domain-containing protein [Streptomyces albus subsp. chlorinus]